MLCCLYIQTHTVAEVQSIDYENVEKNIGAIVFRPKRITMSSEMCVDLVHDGVHDIGTYRKHTIPGMPRREGPYAEKGL